MKVKFVPQNVECEIKPGQSVLHVAQDNGIYVKSVCRGVPSCAECRVRVVDGEFNVLRPGAAELALIGTAYFVDQRRLSCQLKCFGDITVDLTEQIEKEKRALEKNSRSRAGADEMAISRAAVVAQGEDGEAGEGPSAGRSGAAAANGIDADQEGAIDSEGAGASSGDDELEIEGDDESAAEVASESATAGPGAQKREGALKGGAATGQTPGPDGGRGPKKKRRRRGKRGGGGGGSDPGGRPGGAGGPGSPGSNGRPGGSGPGGHPGGGSGGRSGGGGAPRGQGPR